MRVFISGGCKNGKSMLAQRIAVKQGAPLYYIATMIPYDDEDRARIRRHLKEREGWGFETIECGKNILNALDGLPRNKNGRTEGSFLLDSVTALLLNEMFSEGVAKEGDISAGERCAKELCELADRVENIVFVSDFMYSDAALYDGYTENYRMALAAVDRALAERCESVVEVCVGNKIYYKGREWE